MSTTKKKNRQIRTLKAFLIASGTDVMIFAEKFVEKMAFLTQNKGKLWKSLIITLVFEKNVIFSPKIVENRRKL
jgi:hypothetical protein